MVSRHHETATKPHTPLQHEAPEAAFEEQRSGANLQLLQVHPEKSGQTEVPEFVQ